MDRPLLKGPAKKLGEAQSPCTPRVADRCWPRRRNPAVVLNLVGGYVSLPLAPSGGNQPWRHGRSGVGEKFIRA